MKKTLILLILLSTILTAQSGKKFFYYLAGGDDDYYIWTPVTGTNVVAEGSGLIYGGIPTKVKSVSPKDSGGTKFYPYIKAWYEGDDQWMPIDSTTGYSLLLSPLEDTLIHYKAYGFWIEQDSDTVWAYGADSSFTTLLSAPTNLQISSIGISNEVNLSWSGSARATGVIIERKLINESENQFTVLDTVTTDFYQDNPGVGTYTWRVKAYRTNESAYSDTVNATLSTTTYYLTFNNANFGTIDSTNNLSGESGIVADAEGISDFNSYVQEGGNTFTIDAAAKQNGDYGYKTSFDWVNDDCYGVFSSGLDNDSISVRMYFYVATGYYPFADTATLSQFKLVNILGSDVSTFGSVTVRANNANLYLYRFLYRNGGTTVTVTPTAIAIPKDQWNILEVITKRGNGDGYAKCYFNGAPFSVNVGLTNVDKTYVEVDAGVISTAGIPKSTNYAYFDDIKVAKDSVGSYSAGSGDNEDTLLVKIYNPNGSDITISSVSGLSSPFTSTDPSGLILANDSSEVTFYLNTNYNGGIHKDTLSIVTDQTTQQLITTATLVNSPPELPTNLIVTNGNRSLYGSFTNNGGTVIILWDTTGNAVIDKDTLAYGVNTFVITGLDSGATYDVALRSENAQYISSDTTATVTQTAGGIETDPPVGGIITADFYFDSENGDDSNDGTTSATAWQTVTKFNATTFPVGAIIAFRDSMEYRGNWTLTESGENNNNITVTNWYGSASNDYPEFYNATQLTGWTATGGYTNVWQTSATGNYAVWFLYADSVRWGVIESGLASLDRETEIYYSGGLLYAYAPTDPDSRYSKVLYDPSTLLYTDASNGINVRGDYITLQYLNVGYLREAGIMIWYGAENINIYDCNTYFNGKCFVLGTTSESGNGIHINSSNITVKRCTTYENGSHGWYCWNNTNVAGTYTTISNITVDSSIAYNNHHTVGLDINTGRSNKIRNVTFSNNIVYQTSWFPYHDLQMGRASSMGIFITAQGGWGNSRHLYYYNNTVTMRNGNCIQVEHYADSVYVQNNTLAVIGSYDYFRTPYYSSGNLPSYIWIRNNITYSERLTNKIIQAGGTATIVQDYNLLYRSNGSSVDISTLSLGANDLFANPLFTNIPARDFTIQSGSPAINAGATLGAPYNLDMLGISRPQGAGYDIGAYEYVP